MADRYRVFIDLPPSDLSDLDPRFEAPRWEELLYYDDLRATTPLSPGDGHKRRRRQELRRPMAAESRLGAEGRAEDDLARASGVCPSFGRILAAPLADASLARETKEAA